MDNDSFSQTEIKPHDGTELHWRVHLVRRNPRWLPVVLAAAIAAGGWAMLLFHNVAFSVLAVGVVLASLSEYLFPIRYTITHERIACHTLTSHLEMRWSDVHRMMMNAEGIKLSPLRRASRLDAYRGIYLRFADDPNSSGAPESVLRTVRALGPARSTDV